LNQLNLNSQIQCTFDLTYTLNESTFTIYKKEESEDLLIRRKAKRIHGTL